MGHFRFWRRMKIAPGLTLNLSKSGGSLSFGPRGAKYTVGPRGRRTTVGIPGTGLFYTSTASSTGKISPAQAALPAATVPVKDRLTMGFFKRLVTSPEEEAFVDGCRELSQENHAAALRQLSNSTHLVDGAFLAGFLYLKNKDARKAIPLLEQASRDHRQLGRYFDKYGLALALSLPITAGIAAHVGPTRRGALLALVEAYQITDNWKQAHECLQGLRNLDPDDVVILLSLVELFWAANEGDDDTYRYIVSLTKGIQNESSIHSALLLYKTRALRGLNMYAAAKDILSTTLRRKKGRSPDLMLALRYERALCYEALGQAKRARTDFEKIYAEDPDFEDVWFLGSDLQFHLRPVIGGATGQ